MDWTRILEVTLPALLALGGVYLGSWWSNRQNEINRKAEAEEHEKARQEKRREAITELAMQLKRDNIQTIQCSIDSVLKAMDLVSAIFLKERFHKISHDELVTEINSAIFDENAKLKNLGMMDSVSYGLAFTISTAFVNEYLQLNALWVNYLNFVAVSPLEPDTEHGLLTKERMMADNVAKHAGELRAMLQGELLAVMKV